MLLIGHSEFRLWAQNKPYLFELFLSFAAKEGQVTVDSLPPPQSSPLCFGKTCLELNLAAAFPKGPKHLYGTKYGFYSSNFPYGLGKYSPYWCLGLFGEDARFVEEWSLGSMRCGQLEVPKALQFES